MNKGFSLIEIIIYISIIAGVLLAALSFTWSIIYADVKAQTWREIQQNSRFSMEKITQALESGQSPAIFNVTGGTLYENNIALTTNRVKVTNFQINSLGNTYKIYLTIEHINPNNQNQYKASISTETSVASRIF